MTGRDPFGVGSLREQLRNIGESDLQRAGEIGGRLVSKLADRAMLIGRVLLVTEDLGGGGTGHRHRQNDDPGAPAGAASCEPRAHWSPVGHRFQRYQRLTHAARSTAERNATRGARPGAVRA